MGRGIDSTLPVHLTLPWLETGVHMIGPSGSGKTRLLLYLFSQLAALPRSTVVLFNPKGDLGTMARDFCVSRGLTRRLRVFDPSDPDLLPGFNPLRRYGLPVATQAKAVREAILAGHGQTDLDRTQQLARHLLLSLYSAIEQGLTLIEAATLLRSRSLLRTEILARVQDPIIREALGHFHQQRPERQDELAASTLARLEAGLTDPLLRAILTSPSGLDLGESIREHQILVFDIRQYQPLRPADVKFLGRLILNDLLAHVFARRSGSDPVYLLIDEVEVFATEDLCRAFDLGRELGLRTIVSHQHLDQLTLEDNDRRLRSSIMTDARTKIVFGGLPTEQLSELVPDLYLAEFNPLAVKDELTSLECEPVETTRRVVGFTSTRSSSGTHGTSETEGITVGEALSRGEALTTMHATSTSMGSTDTGIAGQSVTTLPTGELVHSDISSGGFGTFDSSTESTATGVTDSRTTTTSRGLNRTKGESHSTGWSSSYSTSVVMQPFHEFRKRRNVSSRTFWTEQEFLTTWLIATQKLPRGGFVVKVPTKPAVRVHAAFVPKPTVTASLLAAARARLAAFALSISPSPTPASPRLLECRNDPRANDDHTTTVPRRRRSSRSG